MSREMEKQALSPQLKALGLARRFLRQSPRPQLARDMTVVRSLGQNILNQSLSNSTRGGLPNPGAVSQGLSSAHRGLRLSGRARLHGGTQQLQGMVDRGMSNARRVGGMEPPNIGKILTPPKAPGPRMIRPSVRKPAAPKPIDLKRFGRLGRGSGMQVARAS